METEAIFFMVQLILDTEGYNVSLPESIKGGYTAILTTPRKTG